MKREFSVASLQFETERCFYAVKTRNFLEFRSYLCEDKDFFAELPGGVLIKSLPSFLESQRHWFEGNTGEFDYSILDINLMSQNIGVSRANVLYSNVDSEGKFFERRIEITFKFKYDHGKWFLFHIENKVL